MLTFITIILLTLLHFDSTFLELKIILFTICYFHFLIYYLFYVNYYLCFVIRKCFVLIYNIGIIFLTFFYIVTKWNYSIDFTEFLTILWSSYVVIFSINILLSFPVFSLFFLINKPLKHRRNVQMHKREIKMVINLMILYFCSSYGLFLTLIYIIFINITSDSLALKEKEKSKRY